MLAKGRKPPSRKKDANPDELLIVSPEPEITVYEVDPQLDGYLVIASDGVWDALSSKRVVRFPCTLSLIS